jgi:hypothetical protein
MYSVQSFKLREAEIDRNREAKLIALRQALQERNEAQVRLFTQIL